jgi:hypothetical protein
MKTYICFLLFLCTLALRASLPMHSFLPVTYYVSPSGKDTNSGTSTGQAFKTITKALNTAQQGDKILIQGGVIYNERIIIPRSGTGTLPITIEAYGNTRAIITGTYPGVNPNARELLFIENRSNLVFKNLHFKDNYRPDASGIRISGACSNVRFENCEVSNIGWNSDPNKKPQNSSSDNAHGIWVKGTSNTVTSNIQFINCKVRDISPGYSEGFTIAGNVDNFLIQGDTVFNIKNIGIDVAGYYPNPGVASNLNYPRNGRVKGCMVYACNSPIAYCAGIYIDGAKNITVESNRSHQCQVAYSIGCETAAGITENIYLRNNIGTNCFNSALYLGSSSGASTVRNTYIFNNTFVNDNQGSQWGTEVVLFSNSNCVFKQNIVIPRSNQHYSFDLWNTPTVTGWSSSYNLFYRFNGNTSGMAPSVGTGANAIFGDPKFISTTLPYPNYHLTAGSKAINKGDPAFFPATNETDIDGENRRQAGRVDIGADESPLSAREEDIEERRSAIEIEKDKILILPNPARNFINVRTNESFSSVLQIIDFNGLIVASQIIENNEYTTISIENLPSGYYIVKLGNRTGKFVKEP